MLVIGWLGALGLLVLAVLRLTYHDATPVLTWFNAFSLYVYLPAYLILAYAVWDRRWLLATLSIFVVSCHLAWIAPDFRPAKAYTPPAGAASTSKPLRIFFQNVHSSNSDYQSLLEEISNVDPDVVVLVEVDPHWYGAIRGAAELKAFEHGTDLRRPFPGEIIAISKLPIRRLQRMWAADCLTNIIDLELDNSSLRIYCLHGPRPLYEFPNDYTSYWQKMEPILTHEHGPLVVIGDFNATQHSLVYERLTDAGLRSAHVDRGRGYATTWPNGKVAIPPIRIDQAMISGDVECLKIAEGDGGGSDHKSLLLDLRVH